MPAKVCVLAPHGTFDHHRMQPTLLVAVPHNCIFPSSHLNTILIYSHVVVIPMLPFLCSQKLGASGVGDNDIIQVLPGQAPQRQRAPQQQQQQAPQQQQAQAPQQNPALQMNPDGSAVSPMAFISTIKADANALSMLAVNNPGLHKAIRDEDVAAVQDALRQMHR